MADTLTPLIVDTGAFYAWMDSDDTNHGVVRRVFESLRAGELPYRPLYTTQAVLSETATLCLRKLGHDAAFRVVEAVQAAASFTVLPVTRAVFTDAVDRFAQYDDQTISFVDHTTAVVADERDVDHVFGFDSDFHTLGFSLFPDDVTAIGG